MQWSSFCPNPQARSDAIPLEELGLRVRPLAEWYGVTAGHHSEPAPCPSVLYTTQTHVSRSTVERRKREIHGGHRPRVDLAQEMARKRFWVLDGHHALVAYRELGIEPSCELREPGDYALPPPRFRGRRIW